MSFLPILIAAAVVILALVYRLFIHRWVVRLLQLLGAMPHSVSERIFFTFWRTLYLNWYIVLMLVLLWVLLFGPDVGKDIIIDYLGNLQHYRGFLGKSGSLFSLSMLLFLMSISVWIIPFFLINKKHSDQIIKEPVDFYLSTKILSLMAMGVYGFTGGAFLSALIHIQNAQIGAVWINLIFALAFFVLQSIITWFSNTRWGNLLFVRSEIFKNRYINILFWILIWHLVLIVAATFIIQWWPAESVISFVVPVFMLVSSTVVFRLMFYFDDTNLTQDEVRVIVQKMLSQENRRHSRAFYIFIGSVVLSGMLYYFFAPSLAGTSSLYVLLLVFSFIIMYLDLMRRFYRNGKTFLGRIVAIVAVLVFLVMPFVNLRKQFNVPFVAYEKPETKVTLDSALVMRIREINKHDPTGNIFVICGMGGGSRAGYITANVLKVLDENENSFLNKTLFVSTISGSSPGVYHYLKSKQDSITDPMFLREIYQRNYNSSGVFGFMFADATEAFFNGLLSAPISWFADTFPVNGYHDRNVRIRREYEIALQQATEASRLPAEKYPLEKKEIQIYFSRTWRGIDKTTYHPDRYEQFFQESPGEWPIHLINTFEVNSGRRTVLSPFPVTEKDTVVFNNSILPLQDTSYDKDIAGKDLMYRDATNLSELFPFLSGASTIGTHKKAQFVDGGYFENYGLATAWDVYEYVEKLERAAKLEQGTSRRIKFILIKNSKQEAKIKKKSLQLLAPLTGAMVSPFTGHANHFAGMFDIRFNRSSQPRFYTILFDADEYSVPLTRALTRQHIDSMDRFVSILRDSVSLKSFLR